MIIEKEDKLSMEKYSILKSKGITFIDVWALFYMILVYGITFIVDKPSFIIFAIYFICAIPFFNHLDKFACVLFLLSTMSYYFLGADEGIWSLYTIFSILTVLHIFAKESISIKLKPCLCFIWLMLASVLSYLYSEIEYLKGLFAILYNIVVAILIALGIKVQKDTITSFLPRIAVVQLVLYLLLFLVNGHYDGSGFSVSESINHNTFGSSVAILCIILFVKAVFFNGQSLYKIAWAISFILTIIIGSRNSLLAMVLTSVGIYIVCKKHQGKAKQGGLTLLIGGCIVVLVSILVLPKIGVDITRYNFIEVISSGGSNRTLIWKTLTPVILQKHMWLGYGPSHYCSEQMILSLMNLNYTHTHNTIFEAWGELGFIGLIPFLLILIWALKKSYYYIKKDNHYLMLGFVFIEFILLGLGESFFANIELWIIIGLLLGGKNLQEDKKTSKTINRMVNSDAKK